MEGWNQELISRILWLAAGISPGEGSALVFPIEPFLKAEGTAPSVTTSPDSLLGSYSEQLLLRREAFLKEF